MRPSEHKAPKVKQDEDGDWYARAYLGYDRVTKRQIRPYMSFPEAGSQDEAQKLSDEWFHALTGTFEGSRSLALKEILPRVIENDMLDISENTRRQYLYCARRLEPLIGGIEFDKLTSDNVNMAVKAMKEKGVSLSTQRQTRAFLRAAYKVLEKKKLVKVNPVQDSSRLATPITGARRAIPERLACTVNATLASEMLAPGGTVSSRVMAAATWLALNSGLRRGEVCALRVSDYDELEGAVRVSGTVIRASGGLRRQEEAKTDESNRAVVLDATAAETMSSWFMWRQHAAFAATAREWEPLFCSTSGGLLDPDALTRWFRENRERLGLPPSARFHDLRHTFASIWLAGGGDMGVLKKALGHSDVRTTLKHYAEVMPGMDRASAAKFGARLRREAAPRTAN